MGAEEDFEEFWNIFQNTRDHAKLNNVAGVFFLKIRSVDIKFLKILLRENGIESESSSLKDLCKDVYLSDITEEKIEEFIRKHYSELHRAREKQIEGTAQAALDIRDTNQLQWNVRDDDVRRLIQGFVRDKTIENSTDFFSRTDDELIPRIRDYIIWSYYNQTTNDLIENIVFRNEKVLPALRVGGIKELDFFFLDKENEFSIPLDLKTSYINQSFLSYVYEKLGLDKEEKIVKDFIKKNDIKIYGRDWIELLEKEIIEPGIKGGDEVLKKVLEVRAKAIDYTKDNPSELIHWLYSDQGPVLFNNNNRFFIILFDKNDYKKPWKLKSEFDLIEKKVNEKLESITIIDFEKVEFTYEKGSSYDGDYTGALATVVFVDANDKKTEK